MKANELNNILIKVKKASYVIGQISPREKASVIMSIEKTLRNNKESILKANLRDVNKSQKSGATGAFIDRLRITEAGFDGILRELKAVSKFPEPVGEVVERRSLPNGIQLQKKRFPLGVILMIYESRPNVTIDAASLCLKSGNAVILKGGSEAYQTNQVMITLIHKVLVKFGIPVNAITLLKPISHSDIKKLLKRSDIIDVVIPRGNYGLTTTVAKESQIPVLHHASGGARMYIDKTANLDIALSVCVNAKTQRVGVCNALDVVLVHKDIAKRLLLTLDKSLHEKKVQVRADLRAKKIMTHSILAKDKDYETEFLDHIIAVKIVDSADEGINFIKKHTHGHTEVIIAKSANLIQKFITEIDAAGIMINCSSRLHDGGEFGMGAEMGTATGKLHARGPVGARELTTYKWIAYGQGQIRG